MHLQSESVRARLTVICNKCSGMDETSESYYVTIDFQSESPELSLPYTLIGLDDANPLLHIGKDWYMGTWAVTVGTEMMFDENGEWVANVTRRLLMEKIQVTAKGQSVQDMLIRKGDVEATSSHTRSSDDTGSLPDSGPEAILMDLD